MACRRRCAHRRRSRDFGRSEPGPCRAVSWPATATIGLVVLGAVFLAVTGAEALYADLGHFGRRPIHLAWVAVALPALTLNYLGQGVLVLADTPRLWKTRSS